MEATGRRALIVPTDLRTTGEGAAAADPAQNAPSAEPAPGGPRGTGSDDEPPAALFRVAG